MIQRYRQLRLIHDSTRTSGPKSEQKGPPGAMCPRIYEEQQREPTYLENLTKALEWSLCHW